MTFALKDFEHLKKHFNDCVAFVLKREIKESIAGLQSRRRDELQFLTTVIAELETKKITQESVNILYGAMCVTNTDIVRRMKTGESTSKVFDRLNIAMGIVGENKPSNEQYVTFYKSLNKFLNLIYIGSDSRKGFKKEHPFQTVPAIKLVEFAKIGFESEEATHNAISASMPTDGKSTVSDGSWYKPVVLIPESIVAPFGSFAALKESLHLLVIAETADKNTADISSLDPNRAIQLQFLDTLANNLSAKKAAGIPEPEKRAILAGAMYLVRGQIAVEYGYAPLNDVDLVPTLISNGSVVHTELTRILNAKNTCAEDKEALIHAANQYIRYTSVENVKVKDVHVESIRAAHAFSGISGFSLTPILQLIQKMVRTCRDTAIDFCFGELQKEIQAQEALQPSKPASSYAASISSSLLNWWKKPSHPEIDAEEELEHTAEASGSSVTPT